MSDSSLDDLRVVLRARAGLTPDAEALLAATHAGVRRRRQRRRVTGALAVTVGALLVAGVLAQAAGHHRRPLPATTPPVVTSPVLRVAPPSPLPRPELPFTAGFVPAWYTLENWEINATGSIARYSIGTHEEAIMVTVGSHDHTPDVANRQPVTVNGKPGVLGSLGSAPDIRLIVWPVAPGVWASVQGDVPLVSDAQLRQMAAAVTTRPTPVTSAVRIAVVPGGWQVHDWAGQDHDNPVNGDNLSLCPASVAPGDDAFSPSGCAAVHVLPGPAPATVLQHREHVALTPETVAGTTLLVSSDGQTVERQIDPGYYVEVTGNEFDPAAVVDPAILRQLVLGTGLG